MPDLIHGHYADAGYAGAQLSRLLHVPYVFTGHSLGRVKRERLLEQGEQDRSSLEQTFQFSSRNEAEEIALETASLVITSTSQEVREQYELYEHYQPDRMEIIPPGVDMERFRADGKPPDDCELIKSLSVFLREPDKPIILAVARPDSKKNFETLVHVYGKSRQLQSLANLVLVMGRRADLRETPADQRRVLMNILTLIDVYNLYGKVAYPKTHVPEDIPWLYRHAALSRGVFVNPALNEPFGLTLLEAAACGIPVVATQDGGPQDIIGNCHNGLLIDPLNQDQIEHALVRCLTEPQSWDQWSANGIVNVKKHYSWDAHADRYLRDVCELVAESAVPVLADKRYPRRLPDFDRMIITDLDNTLDGDDEALAEFSVMLHNAGRQVGFGIATGRRLDDVLSYLETHDLPKPDLLATAVGTELYYGKEMLKDKGWSKQMAMYWQPSEVYRVLDSIDGLSRQSDHEQTEFKVSYLIDTAMAPSIGKIRRALRETGLRVKVIVSRRMFLDVLPIRGGSDLAIRYITYRWGFEPEQLLIAGDSGNDEGMLRGRTLGVVVGNYSPELEKLRHMPRVYFAKAHHARGILEGIEHYNFLGHIRVPSES
jgi:sucrose-phosphate synthase